MRDVPMDSVSHPVEYVLAESFFNLMRVFIWWQLNNFFIKVYSRNNIYSATNIVISLILNFHDYEHLHMFNEYIGLEVVG
jgi:hypothetical protein